MSSSDSTDAATSGVDGPATSVSDRLGTNHQQVWITPSQHYIDRPRRDLTSDLAGHVAQDPQHHQPYRRVQGGTELLGDGSGVRVTIFSCRSELRLKFGDVPVQVHDTTIAKAMVS